MIVSAGITLKLFDTMAREIGQKRVWINDKKSFFLWLNKTKIYDDCRVSVFRYTRRLGIKNYGDADPKSAVIDKIYIDTDSFYGYEVMKLLNERLCDQGLIHRINYSARFVNYATIPRAIGFHIYVFCYPQFDYPKQALANTQMFMDKWARAMAKKEFGITEDDAVDSAIIGDLMRMSRYPNTFNKKWKRWCIPLTQEDIDKLSPFDIYKLGAKPRKMNGEVWLGGENLWKIPKKFDKEDFDRFKFKGVNVPKPDSEWSKWLEVYNVPDCIMKMVEDPHLDYQERFWFIVSLRDIGLSRDEIDDILKATLDFPKYMHCVYTEGMLERCFKGQQRTAYFTSGCEFMKSRGFCPKECSENCGRDHPVYT